MVMASMSHLMKIFAFNPLFLLLLLFALVVLISRCIIVLVQWISVLFGNIVRVHDCWSLIILYLVVCIVVTVTTTTVVPMSITSMVVILLTLCQTVSVSMMLMVVVRHMDDHVGIHMSVISLVVVVVLGMIMLVWGG